MRLPGTQSAAPLHVLALTTLTHAIAGLFTRAHSTRRVILRDASQEALLLFPTLVL